MLQITIGLKSGECIDINVKKIQDYEELIQSWEISRRMFGNKFFDITDKNSKITIYMPDIVFIRKDEVEEIHEL